MLRQDRSPQARTPPGTLADFDENSNPNSAGSHGSLKKQAPPLAPRESLARESMGSNWFRNYTLDSESTLTNLSSNTSNILGQQQNVGNILQERKSAGQKSAKDMDLHTARPRGRSSISSAGAKKASMLSGASRSGGKKKGRKSLAFSEFGQFSDDDMSEDTVNRSRHSEMTNCDGDMLEDFQMAINEKDIIFSQSQQQSQPMTAAEQFSQSQQAAESRQFAPDSPNAPGRASFAPRASEFGPPVFNKAPIIKSKTIISSIEEEKDEEKARTRSPSVAREPSPNPTSSLPKASPAEGTSDSVKALLTRLTDREASASIDRFESLPESVASFPESSHPSGAQGRRQDSIRFDSLELTASSASTLNNTAGHIHFNINPPALNTSSEDSSTNTGANTSLNPFTGANTPSMNQSLNQSANASLTTMLQPRISPSPEGHIPGSATATPLQKSDTKLQKTPLDSRPVGATPATVQDAGPTLQPSTLQKEQEKMQLQKRKSVAGTRKLSVRPSFGAGGVPVNPEAESDDIPDIVAELLGPDPFEAPAPSIETAPTEADPTPHRNRDLNIFTQSQDFFSQDAIPEETAQEVELEKSIEKDAFFDCEEGDMDTTSDKKPEPAADEKRELPAHVTSLFANDDSPPQASHAGLSLSQPAPASLFSQLDTSAPPLSLSLSQPDPRVSTASSNANDKTSSTPTQADSSFANDKPKNVPSPFLDNRHFSITSDDLPFLDRGFSITSEDLNTSDTAGARPSGQRKRKLQLQPSEKQLAAETGIEIECRGRQSIATPLIPLAPNSTIPTPKSDKKGHDRGPSVSEARSLSQEMSLPDSLLQTPSMGDANDLDDYDFVRMPARKLTPIPEGENEGTTISERSSAVSDMPVTTFSMRETLAQAEEAKIAEEKKKKAEEMGQGTPNDKKRVSSVGDGDEESENWLGRPSVGPSIFPSLSEFMGRKPENEVWNSPSEESTSGIAAKKPETRIVVETTPSKKSTARARTPRSSARKSTTTISFHITSPAPRRTGGRTGVSQGGQTNGTFNLSVTSGETNTNSNGFTIESGLGSAANNERDAFGNKRSTSRLLGDQGDDDDDHSSEIAAALGGATSSGMNRMNRTPREETDMSMALGQTTMFGGMKPMQEDTDMSVLRKSMAAGLREDSSMSIAGATITQMGGFSSLAANAAAAAAARDQQAADANKENFQDKANRRKTMDFFGRSKKGEVADPDLLNDANLDSDEEGQQNLNNSSFQSSNYRTPVQPISAMPIQHQSFDSSDSDSSLDDPPPNAPLPVMAPVTSNKAGEEPAFMKDASFQKEGTTPLLNQSDDSFTLITRARDANQTVTQMGRRGSPLSMAARSPKGMTISGLDDLEDSMHGAASYLPNADGKRPGGSPMMRPPGHAKRARVDGGGNVAELVRNSPRKGPASFGNMTAQMQRPAPKRASPTKPAGEVPYVPATIGEFVRPSSADQHRSRPSFAERIAEASYSDPAVRAAADRTPDFNSSLPGQQRPKVLSPWAAEGYEQNRQQNRPRPNAMSSPMPTRNVAQNSATPRLQMTSPKTSARHMDLGTPAKFPGLEMPTPHKYKKNISVDITGIPTFESTRAMLQPIGWYFEGLSTTEQRNTVVADISRGAVTVSQMTQNNCVRYRSSIKYVRTYSTQTEIYLMFPMENEVILQVQEEVGTEKSAVCHIRLKEKPFSNMRWQGEFFEHWKQITLCDFVRAFNIQGSLVKIPLSKNALAIEWFNEAMQDLEFLQWEMHRLDCHWPQGVNYDMIPFDNRRHGETGMAVQVQLIPHEEYRKNTPTIPPAFKWKSICRDRRWYIELTPAAIGGGNPCHEHNIDLARAQDRANEVLRASPLRQPSLYDSLYAAVADIRIQYGAYRLAPFGPWVCRRNL